MYIIIVNEIIFQGQNWKDPYTNRAIASLNHQKRSDNTIFLPVELSGKFPADASVTHTQNHCTKKSVNLRRRISEAASSSFKERNNKIVRVIPLQLLPRRKKSKRLSARSVNHDDSLDSWKT